MTKVKSHTVPIVVKVVERAKAIREWSASQRQGTDLIVQPKPVCVNSIKDLLLDVEFLQSWPMIDMYKDSLCIKKVLLDGVRPVNHGEKRAPDGRSCLSIWIFLVILMSSCARS